MPPNRAINVHSLEHNIRSQHQPGISVFFLRQHIEGVFVFFLIQYSRAGYTYGEDIEGRLNSFHWIIRLDRGSINWTENVYPREVAIFLQEVICCADQGLSQ